MAKEIGISHTSVQRIWAEHNLKPHLVKSFKVSTDPNFAVKVEDVIGLYLDPPERALVLATIDARNGAGLPKTRNRGKLANDPAAIW